MAENMLDVGPPSSKRPKLNSPALSASDGQGKASTLKHAVSQNRAALVSSSYLS